MDTKELLRKRLLYNRFKNVDMQRLVHTTHYVAYEQEVTDNHPSCQLLFMENEKLCGYRNLELLLYFAIGAIIGIFLCSCACKSVIGLFCLCSEWLACENTSGKNARPKLNRCKSAFKISRLKKLWALARYEAHKKVVESPERKVVRKEDLSPGVPKSELANKQVNLGEYKVSFPIGTNVEGTKFAISLQPSVKNFWVENVEYYCIAPLLRCKPSGTSFQRRFHVLIKSAYFSRSKERPVKVFVFVRQSEESVWKLESTTTLGVNGEIQYDGDHFSDRVVAVEECQRVSGAMGWKLTTFGYKTRICERATEVTWYLMTNCEDSFNEITSLHDKDNLCVSVHKFRYFPNYDLRLKLSSDSGDVVFRPLDQFISREALREDDVFSYNFCLKLSEGINADSLVAMPVDYTIVQENEERRREKVKSSFHLNWSSGFPNANNVYNVNLGTVH